MAASCDLHINYAEGAYEFIQYDFNALFVDPRGIFLFPIVEHDVKPVRVVVSKYAIQDYSLVQEELVELLHSEFTTNPVTALVKPKEETATLYAAATGMPVQVEEHLPEIEKEPQPGTTTIYSVTGKNGLHVLVMKILWQDPVDLEISCNRTIYAARFPYDRGKLHFWTFVKME